MQKSAKRFRLSKKFEPILKRYGIEVRVSEKPSEANIMGVDETLGGEAAAYVGEGIIWVKKTMRKGYEQPEADLILAHEIGHAVMGLFPWNRWVTEHQHEIMANSIALYLATELKIPISRKMLKLFMDMPTWTTLRKR